MFVTRTCFRDDKAKRHAKSLNVLIYHSVIQALVTTEPSTTGRLCFKETMTELLALAASEGLDTVENSTSKVV